jgi:hypothetical protein
LAGRKRNKSSFFFIVRLKYIPLREKSQALRPQVSFVHGISPSQPCKEEKGEEKGTGNLFPCVNFPTGRKLLRKSTGVRYIHFGSWREYQLTGAKRMGNRCKSQKTSVGIPQERQKKP